MPAGLDAATVARLFTRILFTTHLSTPEELATELAANAADADLRDLVIFLVDLEQSHLVPLRNDNVNGGEGGILRVEGTVAGRCFMAQQIISLDIGQPDRRQLWVPLVDGTERVGVMVVNVPAPGGHVATVLEEVCERYAHLAAQLVMSKEAYGDVFESARRLQPMSVAAELQRQMTPPRTMAASGLVITGVMEPCYHAGGDSFDYAVNGSSAHLAIFDAMGHGLSASATAAVAVAAYRNGRRRGLGLVATYGAVDETLRDLYGGDHFASAVLSKLDLPSGTFSWVNAGHPPPLLIRGGHLVKTLEASASTALGMPVGEPPLRPSQESLEPGDRVLLYTDGVTEARTPDGKQFSAERLVEFIERQSEPGISAPETLRRLRNAIMAHQHGRLQDDATVLLCEWRGGNEVTMIPTPD